MAFSWDDEIKTKHFAGAISLLYALTVGGLGWLLHDMHALDVTMAATGATAKGVEDRLRMLEEKANKIGDALDTVRNTELAYLRERIGRAEQKLECVTCSGVPPPTVRYRGDRPRP